MKILNIYFIISLCHQTYPCPYLRSSPWARESVNGLQNHPHASDSLSARMHNSNAAIVYLLSRAKTIRALPSFPLYSSKPNNPLLSFLLIFSPYYSPPLCSSISNGRFIFSKRSFCGYAVEQFSDDEYECDFENHPVTFSSLVLSLFCFRIIFNTIKCFQLVY